MEFGDPKYNAYHDKIAHSSEQLEHMGHSLAFEKMLEAHASELTVQATFDSTTLESRSLPSVLSESHYFPTRFDIRDFRADFTELPAQEGPPEWYLSMAYKVGNNPYRFWSNQTQSTLETTNLNGEEMRYNFTPDVAARFLVSLASSVLDRDSEAFMDAVSSHALASSSTVQALLKIVGQRNGVHRKTILGHLPNLDNDKVLIVKMEETETPRTSGIVLSYHLGWQLTEDKSTAIISSQREVTTPVALHTRFSERRPIEVPPDQMSITLHLEDDNTSGKRFDPDVDREQYDLTSASIMTVIDQYIRPFEHFDQ